jgi:hypothetical protein
MQGAAVPDAREELVAVPQAGTTQEDRVPASERG